MTLDLSRLHQDTGASRQHGTARFKGELVLSEARAEIPEDSGNYHPRRVAALVLEAMDHARGQYLQDQLGYLEELSVMLAFAEAENTPQSVEPEQPAE